MKKWLLGLLIIAGLIFLLIIISSIRAAVAPIAVLIVNQGNVQIDSGNGFVEAKSGMSLKEGYNVKTLAESKATIIFLETSVLRLNENTEVEIKTVSSTSVSISQKTGDTWTKLLKISGISDYEIETPDAVASVRGTAFAVSVSNKTDIDVLEGTVKADSWKLENSMKKIIASLDVDANSSLTISEDKLDRLEKRILSRDKWLDENDLADKDLLKKLKEKLRKKYSMQIFAAKIAMNAKEEDVDKQIDDFVEGRLSIKKSIEDGKVPKVLLNLIPRELKRA